MVSCGLNVWGYRYIVIFLDPQRMFLDSNFNVRIHETGSWYGNRAVQYHLAGCYVCGGCTDIDVSVQEVADHC